MISAEPPPHYGRHPASISPAKLLAVALSSVCVPINRIEMNAVVTVERLAMIVLAGKDRCWDPARERATSVEPRIVLALETLC